MAYTYKLITNLTHASSSVVITISFVIFELQFFKIVSKTIVNIIQPTLLSTLTKPAIYRTIECRNKYEVKQYDAQPDNYRCVGYSQFNNSDEQSDRVVRVFKN